MSISEYVVLLFIKFKSIITAIYQNCFNLTAHCSSDVSDVPNTLHSRNIHSIGFLMCIFIFVLRSTRTENALLHTVCLIERMRHIEGYACLPKIFAICLNRVKLSCTKCFIKCPYCQRWCLCNNQNNQNSANAGRWNYSEDGCWKDLFSVYMR